MVLHERRQRAAYAELACKIGVRGNNESLRLIVPPRAGSGGGGVC